MAAQISTGVNNVTVSSGVNPEDNNVPETNQDMKSKKWIKFDGDSKSKEVKSNNNSRTETSINETISDMRSLEADSSPPPSPLEVVATIDPSRSIHVIRDPLNEMSSSSQMANGRLSSNPDVIEVINDDLVVRSQGRSGQPMTSTPANTRHQRPTSLPPLDPRNKSFKNGDIVVSLSPLNTSCAWISPAMFKPELVPEELMAPSLTLTVEEYVSTMKVLTNDYRFRMYTILYKRVVFFWIALGLILLFSLLISGARGLALFGGGVIWLIMNALGIFICIWIKFKLYRQLEKCVFAINHSLVKHNLILGIDDRGQLSCHKVFLYFIYLDASHCIKVLNSLLDAEEQPSTSNNRSAVPPLDITRIDIEDDDVIITGPSSDNRPSMTMSQKSKRGEKLLLRYSQRWVKEFVRKRLDLNLPLHYNENPMNGKTSLPPRHCVLARCPCQFIEEHLRFKPLSQFGWRDLCL